VHPPVPALCYLLAQIRQTNIGTVTLNQFLFSVFAGASQRHPAAGGVGFNVMAVTANRFQITKVTDVSSIQLPPAGKLPAGFWAVAGTISWVPNCTVSGLGADQ